MDALVPVTRIRSAVITFSRRRPLLGQLDCSDWAPDIHSFMYHCCQKVYIIMSWDWISDADICFLALQHRERTGGVPTQDLRAPDAGRILRMYDLPDFAGIETGAQCFWLKYKTMQRLLMIRRLVVTCFASRSDAWRGKRHRLRDKVAGRSRRRSNGAIGFFQKARVRNIV
jgi:hypothetical protein